MVACVRTNVYEEYRSYKPIPYIGTGMLRKVRKGISYTYAVMGGNTLMIVLAFYVLYIIIMRWEYVKNSYGNSRLNWSRVYILSYILTIIFVFLSYDLVYLVV